jgi:hypothetical protein
MCPGILLLVGKIKFWRKHYTTKNLKPRSTKKAFFWNANFFRKRSEFQNVAPPTGLSYFVFDHSKISSSSSRVSLHLQPLKTTQEPAPSSSPEGSKGVMNSFKEKVAKVFNSKSKFLRAGPIFSKKHLPLH